MMGLLDIFKKEDSNIKNGQKMAQAGNFERAIEFYKQVDPTHKDYGDVVAAIISCMNQIGEYEEAPKWFAQLSESNKGYQQAIGDMVAVYLHLDKYEEAIDLFQKAKIESNPYYAIAVTNYIVTLDCLGEYEKNVDKCDDLITKFEKIPTNLYIYETAMNYFLDLLTKYNKYEAMLKFSEKALKLNPENMTAIYHKGEALYELGKYKEALKCLDEVYCHSDDYVDAAYVKGLIYTRLGDKEEAQDCFEEVDSIESSSASAVLINAEGEREYIGHEGRAPKKRKIEGN